MTALFGKSYLYVEIIQIGYIIANNCFFFRRENNRINKVKQEIANQKKIKINKKQLHGHQRS